MVTSEHPGMSRESRGKTYPVVRHKTDYEKQPPDSYMGGSLHSQLFVGWHQELFYSSPSHKRRYE